MDEMLWDDMHKNEARTETNLDFKASALINHVVLVLYIHICTHHIIIFVDVQIFIICLDWTPFGL